MSIPATQIVASGTPTNRPSIGVVAGNAITMSGISLAPNQPGWTLVSSQGGPNAVTGAWQFGSGVQAGITPVQGAFRRSSGSGVGSGGSGGEYDMEGNALPSGFRLTKAGWILLGLIATLLLTDKKQR